MNLKNVRKNKIYFVRDEFGLIAQMIHDNEGKYIFTEFMETKEQAEEAAFTSVYYWDFLYNNRWTVL